MGRVESFPCFSRPAPPQARSSGDTESWLPAASPGVHLLRNLRIGDATFCLYHKFASFKPWRFLKLMGVVLASSDRGEGRPERPPSRNRRAGRAGMGGAVGGAFSPPGAAPGLGREAVAAAAARAKRRGDWLWRPETSGSRGPSGSPARRGAVGLSAHGSEEGSSAVPPSAAVSGLRRLSRDAPPLSLPPPPPRPPLLSPLAHTP